MPLNAKQIKSTGKARVQQDEMAEGTYMCRVAQVIDTGVRPREKWDASTNSYVVDNDKAPCQTLMVTYEFTTEFVKDADGVDQEDKPRWLSESLNLFSLEVDLATSTKRYKAIDPTMAADGDWTKLIGAPCMVTLTHKKNGKAKISSVTPMPKGIPVTGLKNEGKVFLIDEPDMEIYGSLPEWLQGKVTESLNFKGSALEMALGNEGAPQEAPQEKPEEPAPQEPEISEGEGEDEMPW